MTPDYAELLFWIFSNSRRAPNWNGLFALHDEEDQDYFKMLDEEMG